MFKVIGRVLLMAAVGFSGPVSAGENGLPSVPYVIVDGSATVETTPDYATLSFDIGMTKETSAAAAAYVNDQTKELVGLAMRYGVAKDDIQATTVNVQPDFSYEKGTQVMKGVNVERSVSLTMRDLSKYSDFMQALLDQGIVGVEGVSFDTSHRDALTQRAMDQAIDAARVKAEAAAKHAGASVGKLYALSVGTHDAYLGRGFPLALAPEVDETAMAQLGRSATAFLIPKSIGVTSAVTIVYTLQ